MALTETHSAASALHTLARLVAGGPLPASLSAEQISTIAGLAERHGLAPLLLHSLRRRAVNTAGPLWAPLHVAARLTGARYLLFRSTFEAFDQACHLAGIPVVCLKGFALAHTVYPLPTLRPMGDLDLLVPYERREEALAVADTLGYHRIKPLLFDGYDDLLHHYHLRGNVHDAVPLEIHYRFLQSQDSLLPPAQLGWFWSQTREVACRELRFTYFSPEAHLLYLCAHAIIQHGEADFLLQRYLDLHLLITSVPTPDWATVLERAAACGWAYAVSRGLALAQEYFDTPLPPGLLAQLGERKHSRAAVALAARPVPRNPWEIDLDQFRGLGARARLRLALGLAFPTPEYMRWRYSLTSRWQLPLYYARRLIAMLPHAARTFLSRLRASRHKTF